MFDKRLTLFRYIWELKSFSKAANLMGMTQPNATQQIKKLESELNVKLFERDTHSLKLTACGEILFKELSNIESVSEQIMRKLSSVSTGVKNFVLGGTQSIGNYILPQIIANFMNKNSNYLLSMSIGNTLHITEELQKNRIDLALIEGPFDTKNFMYEHYKKDELLVIGSKKRMQMDVFSLKEYISKGGKVILREIGSGTRHYVDEFCKKNDIIFPSSQTMIIQSFEAIKTLISNDLGISFISKEVCQKEIAEELLVSKSMVEGEILRDFNFIFTKNSNLKFVNKFISSCHKGDTAQKRQENFF